MASLMTREEYMMLSVCEMIKHYGLLICLIIGCYTVSLVCNQQHWSHLDGDGLVNMYNIRVAELLDDQI